jgi:TolB protein
MNQRTNRVTRIMSVGTVAFNLLFVGAGCTSLCKFGSRSHAPNSAKATANASDTPSEPATATHATAPAEQPAIQNEVAADAQTVLTSTEPRWGNERESSGAAAKPVNVFGELDGARRGPFKPVGESGFQQHTSLDEGEDADVTVDPSGKWIAFTSTRHNETGDIYLQRVDGTSVTQLTNDTARDAYPAFSPDGKWVAFSSTRAGNWQIYRMDLDGRNVVQVTSGPMQAIHPSFSPDGTRLVYSALGARSNQWELWTVSLLSGERRQVGYGLLPSWSPDKSADRIAYQRARQRGSRWFSLWTMELVNGEGRRMTEVADLASADVNSSTRQ